MIRAGGRMIGRLSETIESKEYKAHAITIIKKRMAEENWEQPDETKFLDVFIDFYLPRKGMDPNNYLKIPYDVITNAGLWVDDDKAKPQTGLVIIDKFDPRIEINISINNQVGVFKNEKARAAFIKKYEDKMQARSFTALLKKLDEGRLTEKVTMNASQNILIKKEYLKK